MASVDSQGEIVPVELANPEETQIRKGENEPVCSFILPPLFDKHSGWYGNGLIDVAEKFEFGVCLMRGSLFLTYQGRSKETVFAGYPEQKRMTVRLRRIFATTLTQRPVTTVLVGAAQEGSPAKSWALRIGIPRVYQRRKGKGHRRRSFELYSALCSLEHNKRKARALIGQLAIYYLLVCARQKTELEM